MKYLTVFASVLALATAQQFSQPNAERGVTDEEGKFEFNKEFLYNVNEDLSDKFGSFNAQGAVDNFFNFTSAAVTPLGQITAWVGDVAYPTLVVSMAVFTFYLAFQIVTNIFGIALAGKLSILSAIFDFLNASGSAVVQKFVSVASDESVTEAALEADGDERARRAAGYMSSSQLLNLLSGVYQAVQKYEQE